VKTAQEPHKHSRFVAFGESTASKRNVVFTKVYCQELSGKCGSFPIALTHHNSVLRSALGIFGGKTDPNTEILESAEAEGRNRTQKLYRSEPNTLCFNAYCSLILQGFKLIF
jgi:hypothetical protein